MGGHVLSAIGRMLVVPQTQELTPITDGSIYRCSFVLGELLENYDHWLGASRNPGPNFFAILLMLSKHLTSDTIEELLYLTLGLKNHWLRLAVRVVAQRDVPDEYSLSMVLFYDHQVHNMIAALSLLRYTQGKCTQYTESLLLASFLKSWEPVISSIVLGYYMRTMISYHDPPAPPCCLPAAVSAAFNLILPDHQLWIGWTILDLFVHGFKKLSVEWRRAFAEGFFTLSRQPLPRPQGDMAPNTPANELEKILTWDYFHKEEQE